MGTRRAALHLDFLSSLGENEFFSILQEGAAVGRF
jgi:hypothetical protein